MDYIDKVITDKVDNYEIHDNRIHEFQNSSKNKLLYVDENLQVAETDNIVKDVVDKDGTSLKNDYIVSLKDYATLSDIEFKEDKSNKISEFNDTMTDDEYPTAILVKNNLDEKITNPVEKSVKDVLQFDGEKWIADKVPSNFVLDSIKINKLPEKTVYILDSGEEEVNKDGMEVIARYRNISHPDVTFSTVVDSDKLVLYPQKVTSPESAKDVEEEITVKFTDGVECTTTFKIMVTNSLGQASWSYINDLIDSGIAELVWDIGDTKKILFSGAEHDVFVIDIGHMNKNSDRESPNDYFTFCMFIKKYTYGEVEKRNLIGITDDHYGKTDEEVQSKEWYIMNMSSDQYPVGTNAGGWEHSSMRENVLASGYSPERPPEGTVMAKLPEDLRKVMKPIVVWTDNVGGRSGTYEAVTSTDDYLSLLSENEIYGEISQSNKNESYYQTQYKFFENGNITMVYDINNEGTTVYCWLRSPTVNTVNEFCMLSTQERYGQTKPEVTSGLSYVSYAIMPIFKV